jgi:hypothetical protein
MELPGYWEFPLRYSWLGIWLVICFEIILIGGRRRAASTGCLVLMFIGIMERGGFSRNVF